ncbi:hypothetical protein HYC85_028166 [Camellia sinensis]|uniref:Acid phosphatase n=1 Tax=Camellia sinensis TaxID=4442 RepID=A0A7J7FUF9_CAMSI|nr:hypothetical protein HYC85_028166 [Camellia sinensis]
MGLLSLLLFLGTLAVSPNGSQEVEVLHQIHPLRPQSGSAGTPVRGLSCLSWRFGVETHNIIDWKTVPQSCENYIGHYMLGDQYREDSKAVVDQALGYAQSLNLAGDGKDVWVFDIDETTLSNLPYYAHHGFGGSADIGTTAVTYKSNQREKLEKEGYRVLGNMGDQWSDILGTHIGNRTFKLPDPMYYIS